MRVVAVASACLEREEKTNGLEILPRRPECWQEEGGKGREEGEGLERTEGEQNQSLLRDRLERERVRHYQSQGRHSTRS